jgi:hypothetical protein
MEASVLDLSPSIAASKDRISTRLEKVWSSYRSLPDHFCTEWSTKNKITEESLSSLNPAMVIKDAVLNFEDSVVPVLRELVLRLYVDHGKWEPSDASRRFDESHRVRLRQRIIPILQSGGVVELNQFYGIQVQLSHINDGDGEALVGHALNAFGVFMGNPLSMIRAGSKVWDAVTGNSPKEKMRNKLLEDREKVLERFESRLTDMHQMTLALLSAWLADEVATEVQVSRRMNQLELENAGLREEIAKIPKGSHFPKTFILPSDAPTPSHAQSKVSVSIIIVIVLLSILVMASVIGATVLVVHGMR